MNRNCLHNKIFTQRQVLCDSLGAGRSQVKGVMSKAMFSLSAGCLLLAACTGQGDEARSAASSAQAPAVAEVAQASTAVAAELPSEVQRQAMALIGEPVPDFPLIPVIVVPDIVGVQPAQREFEAAMSSAFQQVGQVPGVTVTPARCEGEQFLANSGGITRVHSDGQIYRNSRNGVFRINPDGSGYANTTAGVVRVSESGEIYISGQAEADGSSATVRIKPDGSGYYSGRHGTIRLDGQGDGYWSGVQGTIRINKDGSGYWSGAEGTVRIAADGSGYWSGEYGSLRNDGDGYGSWSKYPGKRIPMAPLPRVPPAGRFPAQEGFSLPGIPCGFIVTLQDAVLFDFDKSDIRADASSILDALAKALAGVTVQAMEVRGHTDSKGSDAYNQTLSERRAQAVVNALHARDSGQGASARGLGEREPVAPNEINGQDNPSGRQLNRRVEIFVRT
ncbi:hypothetical protein CO614_06635 [Lysobacteraceae bacterium NML120232]|nr:hypothetical protein CO614_06635 [Xanthomonadaceae bacterium NML120232]